MRLFIFSKNTRCPSADALANIRYLFAKCQENFWCLHAELVISCVPDIPGDLHALTSLAVLRASVPPWCFLALSPGAPFRPGVGAGETPRRPAMGLGPLGWRRPERPRWDQRHACL